MWNTAASLWAEPAAKNPPPRGRSDRVLAAVVVASAVAEAVLRDDRARWPITLVLGCGLAVAVLFRRSYPFAAATLAFGTFAVLDVVTILADLAPVTIVTGLFVLVLAYALFRWGSGRDGVLGAGVLTVALVTAVLTEGTGIDDALGGTGVLLGTAALAIALRYRSAAREQLLERARSQEREQLARELHDTVAHHVSAIAVQAQAGLFLARSSSLAGAGQALEVIDREAARTLTELRLIVGALRDRQGRVAATAARGLADLPDLVSARPGSPRVDVDLTGDLTGLPPALETALYRVAQEAVTNARRHAARSTRVEVAVIGGPNDVQLTISDDGARIAAVPRPAGFGLVGMAERVGLLGGTFAAGPLPERGWQVRAVFPRPGEMT